MITVPQTIAPQTTEQILFLQSLTPEQAMISRVIRELEQNLRYIRFEFNKSLTKDQIELRNQANAANNIARLAKNAPAVAAVSAVS
jgi:hypothetical protein